MPRRLRAALAALIIVLTASVTAPSATAAPPTHWAQHEGSLLFNAYAFGQVEPCLFVSAWLVAGRTAGSGDAHVFAEVYLDDTCTDAPDLEMSGGTTADVFKVTRNLTTAHVVATLPLSTIPGDASMTLPIDLVFTGTGEVTRTSEAYWPERTPHSYMLFNRFSAAYRQGTVTGTPSWFDSGDLARITSGVVYISFPE